MSKLIVVNKEKGYTSRDVVNKLNHIFNTKRIGHTGTLDPMATGVLVCLVGKYTKLVDLVTSYDKEYIATIKLGIKTDTLDTTGIIIERSSYNITKEDIEGVFKSFIGDYEMTVPKYSAVKINGKKLYEYARSGEEIDLPIRNVEIYELVLLDYHDDIIKFRTKVSKGTYIRSLIDDICTKLNTLGAMDSLVRTKQGNFCIDDSYTLDDIENNNYKALTIKDFLDCEVVNIDDNLYKKIFNGVSIKNTYTSDLVLFMYNNQEVAIYKKEDLELKPYVML